MARTEILPSGMVSSRAGSTCCMPVSPETMAGNPRRKLASQPLAHHPPPSQSMSAATNRTSSTPDLKVRSVHRDLGGAAAGAAGDGDRPAARLDALPHLP